MHKQNLQNAVSPYENNCDGYGNSGSSGNSYILGLTLGAGVTNVELAHQGSQLLDEINAFDIAETDGAYIGQLNMSIVSSFCGPQGLVWGLDLAKVDNLYDTKIFVKPVEMSGKTIDVYSALPLVEATKKLFGTVENKRYPLRPGAHVPFAGKSKVAKGPCTIYAGIGIGIPKDRDSNACLLMEDIGILDNASIHITEKDILGNLAKSIIRVGLNQRVEYSHCFVAIRKCEVKENQIGCALVAAPYFTLAKNALIINDKGNPDFAVMEKISLLEWEDAKFNNEVGKIY